MTKHYGVGRSNYFKVKSVKAFQASIQGAPYDVHTGADGRVCILARGDDIDGRLRHIVWDDEPGAEEREIHVLDLIAEHLEEGQVAVFMHTGAAMPEFLSGYSVAVHSDGRQVRVDLRDVYERAAAEFGIRIGQIPVVGYLGAIVR